MERSRRKTRLKVEGKEDRISALPDSLIHHILSFLPSTEEAIRTGILSKRWQNQWTRVPVLIFDSGEYSDDFDSEAFARFIDYALIQYDCSTIRKLQLGYEFQKDSKFSSKIRFAMTRHVEELILNCYSYDHRDNLLPKFLVDNAWLVKLEMFNCNFLDDWTINWGSLKALKMACPTSEKSVANVLYGSPSLELLEIDDPETRGFFIASKSLKILILDEVNFNGTIAVSCPNLEEFTVKSLAYSDSFPDKVIENVVSDSLLLRSLHLECCSFEKLVIASKSLRKLFLREICSGCAIEISCPNLKELDCKGYRYVTFELTKTPSLICANLDFEISGGCQEDNVKHIFQQLQNVEKLTMQDWLIEMLSKVEMGGLSYSWSNNKKLTLVRPNFEHFPGIICALRSSPVLERLVIMLKVYEGGMTPHASGENCCNSNGIVANCLVSHLKTVEIIGLSERDAQRESVLKLIGFLLKNARVLEKLVLVISKDGGMGFAFEVSQKVSSFTRCSQHATVELLCS